MAFYRLRKTDSESPKSARRRLLGNSVHTASMSEVESVEAKSGYPVLHSE